MNALLRSVAIIVGVPTIIAALYFGFVASDIYVSEARFALRSSQTDTSLGLDDLIGSSIGGSSGQDSQVILDYVHSQDLLEKVQQALDLRAHYGDESIDWLARLSDQASREEWLRYFREQVDLVHDSQSDVVTLRVRAFDPNTAQSLAELVIELGEDLVNDLSGRMEADALETADAEVAIALQKVRAASDKITRFRRANASLNPAAESSALLGIVSQIESSLVAARAELGEKLSYMREDSAAIVSLNNRIAALDRQLRLERGRLVGDAGGAEMSGLIEGYEPLALEQELAQQQYASALKSLELARIEAQRQKQYLVTFIRPHLPEAAIEPRRLQKVLTIAIFSFLTYLIGGLMWSALKDHIGR